MELRRWERGLLKALYLIEAGIVAAQVLGQGSLTSVLFLLTFPVTVLLWLGTVRSTVSRMDLLMLGTAALAVMNVLFNASAAGAQLSFSYLKKVIIFIMSLMFLQTAYRVRITGELAGFIGRVVDVLTVFLIFMFFWRNAQMHLLNGFVTVYLTFRFSNPNLTSLFLSSMYMIQMRALVVPGSLGGKLFHIVLAVFLAFFVVQTQSRNCLLVLAFFTAASVWLVIRKRRRFRVRYGLAAAVAVFPAAFALAYTLLVSSKRIQQMFSFLVGEGKGLDSRVVVWERAWKNLASSPVIGAYYQGSNGTGQFQLHNTHLDIAVSYGVPVLILICILLTVWLHQEERDDSGTDQFVSMLGFACAVMLGMGEAALFSGGLGIYIFMGSLLLLSNRESQSQIAPDDREKYFSRNI